MYCYSFLFFILLLHFHPTSSTSSSLVGINYGLVADNLPSPSSVPPLLRSIGVGRVKLYDSDPTVLRAFADTGIEFIIGLPDRCLPKAAADPAFSLSWVKSNVQSYLPRTKIAAVTIGNEVLTNTNSSSSSFAQFLLPAMESIHSALTSLNLGDQVAVTSAHSVAILSSSYPPSAGQFRRELVPLLCPILAFHSRTKSPFLINAYPYFAYKADPSRVSLDYALFESNPGVLDSRSGFKYDNMLFAQIDAVYAAIAAAGGPKGLEVRVSETGWPSSGDGDEVGATAENAAKYNGNLMRLVAESKGTPMKPGSPVRVYVFALFNENMKPGPASERNYGLFKPDGTPSYHLDITVPQENSTAGGSGSGGDGGGSGSGSPGDDAGKNPPDNYYSVSSPAEEWLFLRRMEAVMVASVVVVLLPLM